MRPTRLAWLALFPLATPTNAQFVENPSALPTQPGANEAATSQVDLGDVDGDGDWDAVFANGLTFDEQNRLWINRGGLQAGTVGTFDDETVTRLPAVQDLSRDVEFADFDSDGDLDLYVANDAKASAQPSRFLVNAGGGFYVDETATRWVGLAGPNSSIAPGLLLPGGGFLDWAHDGDFADFDNDGDLDLFHSSAGNFFSGTVPSRVFLNDGGGFFSEFNPSGIQLASENIAGGQPALWAEGNHEDGVDTTLSPNADIAGDATGSELADVDGDFDIDVLFGHRAGLPRLFENRLGTGALAFRDVSNEWFPSAWAPDGGQYDQEFGDLDGDGDLDLYGVNWGDDFRDSTFEYDGTFQAPATVIDSNWDEEDADLVDYDGDGDVDVYVANYSAEDILRRTDNPASGFKVSHVIQDVPGTGGITYDADAADLDADGDYDVISGLRTANVVLRNVSNVPDTTAPRVPALESLADVVASPGVRAVRAHVLDNAPLYIAAHNETDLGVRVDGVTLPGTPMCWAGGQVFRGEIPANLVGAVEYLVGSTDEYGNSGFSLIESYVGTGDAGSAFGAGSPGSLGVPTLRALSAPFGGTPLHVVCGNLPPATPVLVVFSLTPLGAPLDLGDGLVLNLFPPFELALVDLAGVTGNSLFSVPIPSAATGVPFSCQAFAFDGTGGAAWASTPGLALLGQ